jgi:hypothetical protein
VCALAELHASEPGKRTPFLASSTMDLEAIYDMRDTLGQGAVEGVVVRLGRHRATGEVVAVKQVPKASLVTDRQHETMKREIELMMKVTNSLATPAKDAEEKEALSIIRVYAIIETAAMIYIVGTPLSVRYTLCVHGASYREGCAPVENYPVRYTV